MSSAFPIPAQTIAAGQTVIGPVTPGAGFNRLAMVLDIGALVDPCTLTLQYAEDGVMYRNVQPETLTAGSAVNRDGTPMVPPNASWGPNLGTFGDQPNVTTAVSKVKIVIDNTTAWHTTGGTLTVA